MLVVGSTADAALELKNFEHPMKALCELWDDGVRDGYPVKATWTLEESKFEGFAGPTPQEAHDHNRCLFEVYLLSLTFDALHVSSVISEFE